MKKIEVLQWGVKHIATNHREANYSTDWEEFQSLTIKDTEVPTLSDVQMLCDSVGLDRACCYCDHSWGIIVIDVEGWADTIGQEEYVPTGMELWKKKEAVIGS